MEVKVIDLPPADLVAGTDILLLEQNSGTKNTTVTKLISDLGLVTNTTLADDSAAQRIGTKSGNNVQVELDKIELNATQTQDEIAQVQTSVAEIESKQEALDQFNTDLQSPSGADLIQSSNGNTVQEELNNNLLNDREQWRRSLAEAGLTLADGSFEEGATAASKTDAVWHIAVGQCYVWDGVLPKTVSANSTPASTGGIATGAWNQALQSVAADLAMVNAENSGILNIAQAIQNRRNAVASNTIRVCTWNVQAFATLPQSTQFDNARFNGRLDSQQFVREHIEWLLKIGADIVGVQEFYGTFATKQTRSPGYTTVGSNWRMYPYIDSFMAIETVGKADGRTGFIGGNMMLTTRQMQNGAAHKFTASPSTEGTYRSWSRVEIDVNGTTVAVYNTHLTTDTTVQVSQMAELVAAVTADTATRIFLMGDWNNPNDTLFQPLVDIGFTVSPQINSNNWSSGTWYYDRIIHKGFSAVTAPKTETPPYELGDHKPVYLDLTI